VPESHPAFGLAGPDNLVAFTTARYRETPLVVRGRGPGRRSPPPGVFADLLRAGGPT
jgi:bifunctional aspartokinase / homoserine dehydrogenase 1